MLGPGPSRIRGPGSRSSRLSILGEPPRRRGELPQLALPQLEPHDRLGHLDRARDWLDHGDGRPRPQSAGVGREQGAAEDDEVGAGLGDAPDLLRELVEDALVPRLARVGRRHAHGPHAGAVRVEPEEGDEVLRVRDHPGRGRHDGEAVAEGHGERHRSLRHGDHGDVEDLLDRRGAVVAEAGQHDGVREGPDVHDGPGQRPAGPVIAIEAVDDGGTLPVGPSGQLGARRRGGASEGEARVGDRLGRVGVGDEDPHRPASPAELAFPAWCREFTLSLPSPRIYANRPTMSTTAACHRPGYARGALAKPSPMDYMSVASGETGCRRSCMPSVHEIRIEPLTDEAFAPFGQIIAAKDRPADFRTESGTQGWAIDFRSGTPLIMLLRTPYRGLSFTKLERHFNLTQTFLPVGGSPAVVAVAPPSATADRKTIPAPDRIRAFLLDGTKGYALGVGTWHSLDRFPLYPPDTDWVIITDHETQQDLTTGQGGGQLTNEVDYAELGMTFALRL